MAETEDVVARGISWRQAVGIPLNVLAFLFLMILGWGSWSGFFAHPTRTGLVLVHLAMAPIMTFCTAGRSRGIRPAPDWKPFFPLLVAHSLFTSFVMPYMDARDIAVLPGGDALRWTGFTLLAAGALFRVWPMLELRGRFASVPAIQPGHRLHTNGIYARTRHPSYLGILLLDLGFAGIFRSLVGLLLLPLVFWMFVRRMDVEERLLLEEFGDPYRDYMRRSARLLPGVY